MPVNGQSFALDIVKTDDDGRLKRDGISFFLFL
jgi:hypothetical protein